MVRRLRIGINATVLGAEIRSGIPRHIWEICRQWEASWPEAEFFLYMPDGSGLAPLSDRWSIREEPQAQLRKLRPNLWLKARCGLLATRDHLDVFWSGTGLSPFLPSVPICLTVHDINIRLAPETMPPLMRVAFKLFFETDLRSAAAILTVSRGTAERLWQHYGVRTAAIPTSGIGPVFCFREPAEQAKILGRFGLGKPFCLAVGTIEPRKNILGLLEAFSLLDRRGQLHGHQLALVGKAGWDRPETMAAIAQYERTWLRRLGPVTDDELASLYSAASLFVFPSHYEGLGLPPIEARACGTRVAITDIPELRENAAPDAILIPGTSPEIIADAIAPALLHPSRSPYAGDLPSWPVAALRTRETLELVAQQKLRDV